MAALTPYLTLQVQVRVTQLQMSQMKFVWEQLTTNFATIVVGEIT